MSDSAPPPSADDNENDWEPTKLTVEQAIDRLGMGRFQQRLLIACGLTNASDSMEVLLLSFLAVVVQQEFGVTAKEGSLLTSVVFVGAMIGTLVLGAIGDRWGRKPAFLLSCIIMSTAGILTALSPNYWIMVVSRFGVGIGLGGAVIPYDTLAEFLPSSHRGNYLVRFGFFWTLGTMSVPLMAWLGIQQQDSWRLFLLLCSIPCLVSTILAFCWVPESPRFLISKGKHDVALRILQQAATVNGLDAQATFPDGMHFVTNPNEEEELHSIKALFQNKEWIRLTLSLWAVWIGKSFMYWGSVQIITLVFTGSKGGGDAKNAYDFDYAAIFTSSTAEMIGVMICLLLVDRTGRMATQSVLYMLGGAFIFGLCWIEAQAQQENNAQGYRPTLITLAFFARMCTMGGAQLTWAITAEIIPTQIRTTGHSMANAVARIGGATMPWLASPDNSFQTQAIAMLIIGIWTGCMVCLLPETAGKSLGTARRQPGSYDPEGNPIQNTTEREDDDDDTEGHSLKLNEIS